MCLELELKKLDNSWNIEPDLRHAPLIMQKNLDAMANTKTVSTPREKTTRQKLVLDGRTSPILKKEDETTMQVCVHETFLLGPSRLDLAETATILAQRTSEPRGIQLCSTEACSTVSGRGTKAAFDPDFT